MMTHSHTTSPRQSRWKGRALRAIVYAAGVTLVVGIAWYHWHEPLDARQTSRGDCMTVGPGDIPKGWNDPLPIRPHKSGGPPGDWVTPPSRIVQDSPTRSSVGIVVLPFSAPGDDSLTEPIASAAAEVIAGRLSQDTRCIVVEREQLDPLLGEQKLSLTGLIDKQTAVRAGALVGATTIVTGHILPLAPDRWAVVVSAYAVVDGRLIESTREEIPLDDLVAALMRIADSLAEPLQLALPPLPSAMLDHHPEASLHRMRAMADLAGGHHLRAILSLMKVQRLDAERADTAYWMGVAYARAGLPGQASIEFHRYLSHAPQGQFAEQTRRALEALEREHRT